MTRHRTSTRRLNAAETQQHIEAMAIEAPGVSALAHQNPPGNVIYDWHSHRRHQLLYAISGILRVETRDSELIVSPQRALWIPASVLHRTRLEDVSSASVFISDRQYRDRGGRVRVLAAPPLMREMILHALRWGPSAGTDTRTREQFFRTLCILLKEWMNRELPCALPRTDHPALFRALRYAHANLETVSLEDAARAAAVSVRTLRRLITAELRTTWREYLNQTRMNQAMVLLCQPSQRVARVAEMTGFGSVSAFSARFRQFAGETPREYRYRALAGRQITPGSPGKEVRR